MKLQDIVSSQEIKSDPRRSSSALHRVSSRALLSPPESEVHKIP